MAHRLQVKTEDFSLEHTLRSGHSFCWQWNPATGAWEGWIQGHFCEVRQHGHHLEITSPSSLAEQDVRAYFRLEPEWAQLLARLPAADAHLACALEGARGLRCLREPWWECTANFICSSLKQIVQIAQINRHLREAFGERDPSSGRRMFPSPQRLAEAGEQSLRACRLGYRARHLHAAAVQIASGAWKWDALAGMPTREAAGELQKLPGVGDKIAHCILLYAAGRMDAFPVDVWVERLLRQLYRPRLKKGGREQWHRLGTRLFGNERGLAQLYLFHWYRTLGQEARTRLRPDRIGPTRAQKGRFRPPGAIAGRVHPTKRTSA
jgi:N-glycosylase/DNA lyase